MPYKIRNWDEHYETNDTRKLVNLHWVKIPNQQDSLAYRLIAAHKKGPEIFAAWVLMVQVASKGKREERGNLPLSPEELGIVTGFPAEIFSLAIDFLKTPKIAWIEQSPDNLPESPEASGNPPGNLPLKEGRNGTEQKEDSLVAKRDDSLREQFREALKAYPSGKKRGAEVEWIYFLKKHGKNKAEIVPLLLPAIQGYVAHLQRENTEAKFIKHFQGWITDSLWTVDYSAKAKNTNGPKVDFV